MALLQRDRAGEDRAAGGNEVDDRPGPAPGLVRALFTLAGLAVAGFLIWLASTFSLRETGEFWAAMGLVAAAGFVLGLSQLLGGWTKWGVPRLSPMVFLLAFLPTLVLAGGLLLAMKPTGTETDQVRDWANDLGIGGLVEDYAVFPGLLAFAIGLVLAFVFDTTGRRARVASREPGVPEEDVHDYRRDRSVGATSEETSPRAEPASDRTVADEIRSRDEGRTVADEIRSRDEGSDTVSTGAREERGGEVDDPERRDRT